MSGVFLNEKFSKIVILKYNKLQSFQDLVDILNIIEKNDQNSKPIPRPITPQHLFTLARTKEYRYSHFQITKKSGSSREIKTPDERLKRIQRLLNCMLQIIFEPKAHYCANGFIYGRDIIRNAKPHVNKAFVLNCDIKDFFPSINFRRVKTVLELQPFDLRDKKERIGFLIANLCVYQNSLPQGAPTSPLLSNIVTQNLDRKLNTYSLSRKVKYSRYADDLSFSSNRYQFDNKFIKKIKNFLTEENFEINSKKTRVKSDMERQQVTGLVVNEKINVKREYIQKVRAMLNNWEKVGIEFARKEFRRHQPPNKRNYDFVDTISGHVSFIGNIRGKEDRLFKVLHLKLNNLKNRIDYSFIDDERVKKVLIRDNLKMENILHDNIHSEESKFISFCASAFHQVENLLKYYYHLRFPDFNDLLRYLLENNPLFGNSYRSFNHASKKIKKIKGLSIYYLVYMFEKDFYLGNPEKFYDRRLSKLREIRNEDSHRHPAIEPDKEKLISDFKTLQVKKNKHFIENSEYLELSNEERDTEFKHGLIEYLEKKDYTFVRKTLKELGQKVKKGLQDIPSYSVPSDF